MIPFDDIQRIESVLQEVFGHRKLRPAQERALAPILAGKDAVVIMPTGTGKSLCYQLPGLLDEGLTLVVSPLISLMKDQVDSLRALGVPAGTMNSSQSADEARSVFSDLHGGVLRFLYVSPERLSQPAFAELMARSNLRRVAVDEAHCVSAWGHDFRPDYLQVGGFLDRVGRPQTLALTATATPAVQEDIVRSLGLDDPQVVVTGFDRPNLSIYVRRVRGAAEHGESLNRAFDEFDAVTGAALVYCASRKNTELVARLLKERGFAPEIYHAGLSPGERTRVQESFMSGQTAVVVATNAFGMGIDRADVRLVLHYDCPGSLEAYYQEIGRAGRDGQPARAVLLFSEGSIRLQRFFIERAHPTLSDIQRVFSFMVEARQLGSALTLEEVESRGRDRDDGMALRSAAFKLVGSGLANRRGLDSEIHLAPDIGESLNGLIDEEELEMRRRLDEDRLRVVSSFARRSSCRRDAILDHFRAEREEPGCGRCDVCLGETLNDARDLDDRETTELLKLLSGVARARGRVGRQKVALMLSGSKAQDIAGSFLCGLSTYGLLEHCGQRGVLERLDAAIEAQLVMAVGDDYPVLTLSSQGLSVLKGAPPPPLNWPGVARSRASNASRAEGGRTASSEAAERIAAFEGDDRDLAQRLRAYRSAEASRLGVPAYRIFGNRTLDDLVTRRPRTTAELEAVHGLGPVKIEALGTDLLDLLQGTA